jgi:hypothetical protein
MNESQKPENSIQWENIFKQTPLIVRETKLQSFQYKIIHRTIACKKWLFNIKISNSDICTFCDNDTDNIQHFFLLCKNTYTFWVSFDQWWHKITNNHLIDYSEPNKIQFELLLGFPDKSDKNQVLNYCILHVKFYIYSKKINNINILSLLDFLPFLKKKLQFEKHIQKIQNKIYKFDKFLFIYNNL